MNYKGDNIRSDSLCWGSAGDFTTITELLQLVLCIVAERVFRRVIESREKGLSASSCPSVRPSVRPSFFIYQLYIIYHISIWLPLYLDNTYEQKLCCLSVATRHKVSIQATNVCWWSNIQGIVTVELTSAADWRLSSTVPLQLRSACKVSVVVCCTFPNSTICVGQFLLNLRIQRCSSVLIPTTRNTVVCKKSITV